MRDEENTFQILVATDIHLGYEESNPIRGDDSFNTFEEILQIAIKKDVDFILLGGDLFHENRPSMNTMCKCVSLLRKYCMGDKPVSVEFISKQDEIFKHCFSQNVNYEDPNLNISIPVFSIHGNHDDPAGYNCLGSMDVLSATGHINYFNKWTDLTQVNLSPLLLRKGSSKLAIYGLSHIKDERLARLFREKKVEFQRPTTDPESWCSVMVLHQNRADRGINKFVKEEMLPSFLQLVIWGHEHECRVFPEFNGTTGFRVIQPGSPVATSLSEGESVAKHVAILKIAGDEVFVQPIELETVRPFVFDNADVSKIEPSSGTRKISDQVMSYVSEKIESMLRRARDKLSGNPNQPRLPLIRLRVEYNDEKQYFNPIRFGQGFTDRVANPTEMILMKRDKRGSRAKKGDNLDKDAMEAVVGEDGQDMIDSQEEIGAKVEKVIELYFGDESNNKKLTVLSTTGINEAVTSYIEKEDKFAIKSVIKHQKDKTIEYLKSRNDVCNETIDEIIEEFRVMRAAASKEDEEKEITQVIEDSRNKTYVDDEHHFGIDSDEEIQLPTRGRGSRGRGRGSRARGKASPAKAKSFAELEKTTIDIDSDEESVVSVSSTRRGRGSRASAAKTTSTRGRRGAASTAKRGSRNGTSQMSIQDMFASEVSTATPAKRRKMTFESDSD